MAVATSMTTACPLCGRWFARVHSQYRRQVTVLPINERTVLVILHIRHLVCVTRSCPRRIFTEHLPTPVTLRGRHNRRQCDAREHLGFTLGGEARAHLAPKLDVPTSSTTLMHLVRTAPTPAVGCPQIIGSDDYARKGDCTYSLLIYDHEQCPMLDLLPDRSADTATSWLAQHPNIQIIPRDRGNAYIDGATQGAPAAVQVVDLWHLLSRAGELVKLRHQRVWRRAMIDSLPDADTASAEVATPLPATRVQRHLLALLTTRVARSEKVHQCGHSLRAMPRTFAPWLHQDKPALQADLTLPYRSPQAGECDQTETAEKKHVWQGETQSSPAASHVAGVNASSNSRKSRQL